jgi:phosphate transport system protein
MERHFETELEKIRSSLFAMAGKVEEHVALAMRGLVDRDSEVARRVIALDAEVDRLEMEIDEACMRLLVLQDPKARDLRLVVMVMKIVNDLERIGDSAKNMAQAVLVLNQDAPLKPYVDLPRLAQLAQQMVADALDSLAKRDAALARDVIIRDDEVDALYRQIFRELVSYMVEDPKTVTRALELVLYARNLERVADHATNIAENIVYYLEAKDIRHTLSKSPASQS